MDAVDQVSDLLGRPLTLAETRVVQEEGYAEGCYKDTKGIRTCGVGQTGIWIKRGFEASFAHHVLRVRNRIPRFAKFPLEVQAELIQSEYRGDLGISPKALQLLNAGQYHKASIEFLNNDEYRDPMTSRGIRGRMEATANAIASLAG